MDRDETSVMRALQLVFGYEQFQNDVQRRATITVNEGSKHVCISMPPGFGRSLCYQLPAVLQKDKVALVFSPRLSTIKNHVDFLKSKQINARFLSKGMYMHERKPILRDLTSNSPTIVLLYTTPDMALATYFQKLVLSLKQRNMLSYIVFNEAHCLSEKGYEYTPWYKKINLFDKIYGHVSKIAVTTTVTDEVIEDICELLSLRTPKIFKIPMQQININRDVWFLDMLSDPFEHLKSFIVGVLGFLESSICKMPKGFAIIYCREIAIAELIQNKLITFGIPTLTYHHKLNSSTRHTIENKWIQGEANVITTTYNYGFIHKQSIRCIVYWTVPENIPKYYRESAQICTNNTDAYCRIYFSTEEYSSVKLAIENHRQMKDPEHIRRRLKEYDKLVSYCLFTKCRHAIISNYFGYATAPCSIKCDVCNNKENVEIRTHKFTMYSENVKKIKYNLYNMNENLKKIKIQENDENQSEETVENITRERIPKERNSGEGTVQYNGTIRKNKHKPSFGESSSLPTQLSIKNCIVRITREEIRAKDNSNAIGAGELAITQCLMGKCKLNNEAISVGPCSAGNNSSKRSKGTNRTQISGEGSASRDVQMSRIRASNSDGKINTAKGRDHISRSASCKATVVTGAKEHGKKLSKRTVAVDTCPEDFKSKRRKIGTENKPTDATLINRDSGTGDRDPRVERIKDDANERASRDRTTTEYLMNKYKLSKDSITLELRRK